MRQFVFSDFDVERLGNAVGRGVGLNNDKPGTVALATVLALFGSSDTPAITGLFPDADASAYELVLRVVLIRSRSRSALGRNLKNQIISLAFFSI